MKSTHISFLSLVILLTAFSGCQPQKDTSAISAEAELQKPATLTICLGYEPESLYPYNAASLAARNVMQAIYDGPIDTINGQPVPVILEKLPSLADGSARFTPVGVNIGDLVVDTAGNLAALQAGTQVFPSGCTSPACAITFDGASPLQMDQLSATYRLKPGVTWSDGQPLTAADSVFSFEVAADPATPVSKLAVDHTAEYRAADDLTVEWVSRPGLATDAFERYFWAPLPVHAWGELSADELLASEEANRQPLGWGAYRVAEWIPGERIRLERNPFYFRAAEGLPEFDTLVFRITDPNGDTNLANLKFDRKPFAHLNYDIGTFDLEIEQVGCDLTTTTADMRDQLGVFNYLLNFYQDPAIKVFKIQETETRFLVFNFENTTSGRTSPQKISEVRKAVSQCIDRQTIITKLSNNLYEFPLKIDLDFSENREEPQEYLQFNPSAAMKALEESGWKDHDDQEGTPRISEGLASIPDGSELTLTLLVEENNESKITASLIKSMLASCGIGINTIIIPIETLWNSLDESSYFQGKFDLAIIDWKTPIQIPCSLFSSNAIPEADHAPTGTNFSRFKHPNLDALCSEYTALTMPAEINYALEEIEQIINSELPATPIFSYSSLLTAQRDFCQQGLNHQHALELSGIEEFRISPDCR